MRGRNKRRDNNNKKKERLYFSALSKDVPKFGVDVPLGKACHAMCREVYWQIRVEQNETSGG